MIQNSRYIRMYSYLKASILGVYRLFCIVFILSSSLLYAENYDKDTLDILSNQEIKKISKTSLYVKEGTKIANLDKIKGSVQILYASSQTKENKPEKKLTKKKIHVKTTPVSETNKKVNESSGKKELVYSSSKSANQIFVGRVRMVSGIFGGKYQLAKILFPISVKAGRISFVTFEKKKNQQYIYYFNSLNCCRLTESVRPPPPVNIDQVI